MDNVICYLNTDLDLTSASDLTGLEGAFKSFGVRSLHVTLAPDGLWIATFETDECYPEPESSIAMMVAAIESFAEPHRSVWLSCTRREFNIGYDCGAEPWEFNQGLSCELLRRVAALGASLRITLYPDRRPRSSSGESV